MAKSAPGCVDGGGSVGDVLIKLQLEVGFCASMLVTAAYFRFSSGILVVPAGLDRNGTNDGQKLTDKINVV